MCMIFIAQLPQLTGVGWETYAMVAGGLAIIYLFPRLTKAVPSPLVAILVIVISVILIPYGLAATGGVQGLHAKVPGTARVTAPAKASALADLRAKTDERTRGTADRRKRSDAGGPARSRSES